MQIRSIQEIGSNSLYRFWQQIHAKTPYNFETDIQTWTKYFKNGDGLFTELDGYVAVDEQSNIVGVVQYGVPTFIWNRNGQKIDRPKAAVLRHFYFPSERPDIGEEMFLRAKSFLKKYDDYYAFYHALGLPNMAGHGKLFIPSFGHIEQFLLENGFEIEHENYYYTYKIKKLILNTNSLLALINKNEEGKESITALLNGEILGTAAVILLDKVTGGNAKDVLYLSWIGVNEQYRGLGYGSEFLMHIIKHYAELGYNSIHLDTASNNMVAQKMYTKLGFEHIGVTKSYMKRAILADN